MAREEDRFSDPNWNWYEDRPGLAKLASIGEQITRNAVSRTAAMTDGIIANAILVATGQEWTLIDVAARMRSERFAGATFQTILLDGEPILELHDATIETTRDESGQSIMRVSQNSRLLGKAAPSPLQEEKET